MKIAKSHALALMGAGVFFSSNSFAFQQITHKRIAQDAVAYMESHSRTTNYDKLKAWVTSAGLTMAQFSEALGQGAYDVDDFQDTYLCGAVTGDCVYAPVFNAGASLVNYTSYWHFQNHTRGADEHGNDFGGYNYDLLTVWGDIDDLAATWLYGDYLDDGDGGMTGWFSSDDSEYNTYGVTEAHYRQGSSSSKAMYDDFETMPFQPIDNLGQYWYSQFLAAPTAQTLGFVLHTTDILQPHHVWTTSAMNHSGWESWVADYYDAEGLNGAALVTNALADFTPITPSSDDIRPLLTRGGAIAYAQGGDVLYSTDHADRVSVARVVVPHAIAMVVHLLNHAAERVGSVRAAPFSLVSQQSSLCIDISGAVMTNGTQVLLWTCTGATNQRWTYDAASGLVRSVKDSSYCLDNSGQSYDGGSIIIWKCHGGATQQWDLGTDGVLRHRRNNDVVADAYGQSAGAKLGSWTAHGGANQRWTKRL